MNEPTEKPEFKVLKGGADAPAETAPAPSAAPAPAPTPEVVVEEEGAVHNYARMVSGGVDEHGKIKPISNEDDLTDKKREKLARKLVKRLPTAPFACIEGCGKCCMNPTEMLRVEWERLITTEPGRSIMARHEKNKVDTFVTVVTPAAVKVGLRDGSCPFLDPTTKKCGVYDQRPIVCRAYGQHWFFRCREGVASPEGGDLSNAQMCEYGKLAMKPYGAMDDVRMEAVRVVVEEWRAKDPEKRRDDMPTYEELKAGVETKAEEARKPKVTFGPPAEPSKLDTKLIGSLLRKEMDDAGGRIILPGGPGYSPPPGKLS